MGDLNDARRASGAADEDYSKVYGTAEYWQARTERKPSFKLSELRAEQEREAREQVEAKLDALLPARALVLRDAEQAVCSDRNAEYGEPIDNFSRWAGTCNALGYRGPDGRPLKPHDLAIISAAGKLCRAMQTPGKRDHSVDTAGYGSLIYELVTLEGDA